MEANRRYKLKYITFAGGSLDFPLTPQLFLPFEKHRMQYVNMTKFSFQFKTFFENIYLLQVVQEEACALLTTITSDQVNTNI